MLIESSKPYVPPICLRVTKEQVVDLSIGDKIKATVSGDISSVRKIDIDGRKLSYEIDLNPSVVESISGNRADKELRQMTGNQTSAINQAAKKS